MATIKMINKDALIPIQIGAGFVQKIQSVLLTLVNERTEQELEAYQKHVTEQQDLPEPWMEHMHLLIVILSELDKAAEAGGFTSERSVDDVINEADS
jgi:hypothetical protein